MEIKYKGGINFNLKGGSVEKISDYTDKLQRVLIPLGRFKFDYRDLFKKDGVKKGEILFKSDQNILLSPLSGTLKLLKNEVMEILSDETYGVSEDSLELIKNGLDYEVLVRLGLLEKRNLSKLKNVIIKLSHTEPFFVKDGFLIRYFSSALENAHEILEEIFPNINKKVIYSDSSCEKSISSSWERIKIRDRYPFDNEKLIQMKIFGETNIDPDETIFIPFEKLIVINNYIKNNEPPIYQFLSIAGNIDSPTFIKVPVYSEIEKIAKLFISSEKKFSEYDIIIGGPFSGRSIEQDSFLHPNDPSLTLLENSRPRKLFPFMRPGLKDHSCSQTFVSTFIPVKKDIDSRLHGENRACVFCGFCQSVCPVDLEPFVLSKHIQIDALEEAKKYDVFKCVDCGLCTHVCPSKIPVSEIISNGKNSIIKENI